MNPDKKRERRIPELERDVLDDDEVRRLAKRGVLRPFDPNGPSRLDPANLARLSAETARSARRRRDEIEVEEEQAMLDHRGRGPDHDFYGADD